MKSSSILILGVFSFICIQESQAFGVLSFGKCAKTPDNPNFDLNRYLGRWYSIYKYPTSFGIFAKCSRADYTQAIGMNGIPIKNQINVLNSAVNTLWGINLGSTSGGGNGTVIDEAARNKLEVRLDAGGAGRYTVVDTDYTSYAIVVTCDDNDSWLGPWKDETAFFLSRSKDFSQLTFEALKTKLMKYSDKTSYLTKDPQDCAN